MQLHQYNKSYLHRLERKKLIKLIDGSIILREPGIELVEKLVKFAPTKKEKKVITKPFDEFWSEYPTTDRHSVYRKTRNLKSNKTGCKKKYEQYLKEGINHEDVIRALRYEVKSRKENSTIENKMSYMKNSFTWLNQKEFEIILETIEEDGRDSEDWTSKTI
jgi:hypothetical protein